MLPACMRETVTAEIGREPLPSSFFYTGPPVGSQTIKRAEEVRGGKKELDTLKELVREAARCGAKDLEWGEKVRIPLVSHTIHSFWPKLCCRVWNEIQLFSDSDPVSKELLPEESGIMDGRVSVTIGVMDEWGLEKDVEKKLIPPGEVGQFVNHVKSRLDDNGQVKKRSPCGCIIESRAHLSDVAEVDGMGIGLGVHAAALHNRLSTFLDAKYSQDRNARYSPDRWRTPLEGIPEPYRRPLIPVLLLIYVAGHDWYLYFACDRGNEIVLLNGVPMGSTRDLLSIYHIVKVLRVTCRYIDEHYRLWLVTLLIANGRTTRGPPRHNLAIMAYCHLECYDDFFYFIWNIAIVIANGR